MVQERSSDERVLGMSVRAIGGTRALVAVLAAGSLFVAGCGDSGSSDSTADSAPAAAPAATTPAAAQAETAASAGTTTVVGLIARKGSVFHIKPSTSENGADQARGHAALGQKGLDDGIDLKVTSRTKFKTATGKSVSLSQFKSQVAKSPGHVMVVKIKWTFKKPPTSPAQLVNKAPDSMESFG